MKMLALIAALGISTVANHIGLLLGIISRYYLYYQSSASDESGLIYVTCSIEMSRMWQNLHIYFSPYL